MPPTPENYRYGGGASQTLLHPIVIIAMVLAIILICVLPRKYVIVPICFMAFLTPVGQQLYIAGIHLYVLRIIILSGLIRAFITPGASGGSRFVGGLNGVDRAFFVVVLVQSISNVLLFREGQVLINQIGVLLDFIGGYVLLRFLIRDEDDIYRALKCFAFVTVPLAIGMVIEQERMLNVFGFLGTTLVPQVREGKIRSQGTFEHALTAGTIAATMIPVVFLLWKNAKSKLIGALGFIGATTMMWTSNSSTPLLAYVAGIGSVLLFPIRKKMRTIRWGIVFGLVALQMVMKAPIWFLIGRVDVTGGSSGYHRAELVDQFIHHFFDWWLIGVKDSANWGLDMFDVQNQYVNVGENGGLLAFILFILMISRSFAMLGDARKVVDGNREKEWMLWCIGCALFANVVGFFGVNYFDQSRIGWLLLLVVISAATSSILANKSVTQGEKAADHKIRYLWKKSAKEAEMDQDLSREPGGRMEPRLRRA